MSGTICPYCRQDTGGNHDFRCPAYPYTIAVTPTGERTQLYICSVCGGRGMVPARFYYTCTSTITGDVQCRACKGKGTIWGPRD